MNKAFWNEINQQLNRIETEKPETAAEVLTIIGNNSDHVLFNGSGGDRTVLDALIEADWRIVRFKASYWWIMQHPKTLETIGYCEGDMYANVHPDMWISEAA